MFYCFQVLLKLRFGFNIANDAFFFILYLQVLEYAQVLEIQPIIPSLGPLLLRVIESTLDSEGDARSDYEERQTNSSWLLGASLSCLAKRKAKEWSGNVDIQIWTKRIIERWGWSGYVMSGLVDLIRAQ